MTSANLKTAKPPVSPHANLTPLSRVGTTTYGSAIWQLVCICGATITAEAPRIKKGFARCPTCNPSLGMSQAARILEALPGTRAKIVRKTKLTGPQVDYRIQCMRGLGTCHVGGWSRAEWQGSFMPIFHAGKGIDAPCTLKRKPDRVVEREYNKRVRKAIRTAQEGGKEDGRYLRQISLHKAATMARAARNAPQGWAATLFAGMGAA